MRADHREFYLRFLGMVVVLPWWRDLPSYHEVQCRQCSGRHLRGTRRLERGCECGAGRRSPVARVFHANWSGRV